MSALRGTIEHVSGYDPRSVVIDLVDGGHDLKPDDEVAVHAVKHAGAEAGETFGQVLGEMLGDACGIKVIEQLAELEAIVRDLAAQDPTVASEVTGDPYCALCSGIGGLDHDDDCPLIRARAWVSAQPVSGDQQ